MIIIPPISSLGSFPPTPKPCLTPISDRSNSVETSCSPVPAAATIPTGPFLIIFEKPMPLPLIIEVPDPGPKINMPLSEACFFITSSSDIDTWSLNIC